MEEYDEVKSLKQRFHPNNTRNEAMICFSTEEEAQLAIAEIITYGGWRAERYKPTKKLREHQKTIKKTPKTKKSENQTKIN